MHVLNISLKMPQVFRCCVGGGIGLQARVKQEERGAFCLPLPGSTRLMLV